MFKYNDNSDVGLQTRMIEAYNNGWILKNDSQGFKDVTTFKFLGKMYTSNLSRVRKYSFDDEGWVKAQRGFFLKLKMIRSKEFKVLQDCKKSKEVGL